jgi:hypothetical protein
LPEQANEQRFLSQDPLRQIGQCLQAFNVVEALVVERIVALIGADRHKVVLLVDGLAAREKFQAYRRLVAEEAETAAPEQGEAWLAHLDAVGRQRNAIAHTVLGDDAPSAKERAAFHADCEEAIFGLQQALQRSARNVKKRS